MIRRDIGAALAALCVAAAGCGGDGGSGSTPPPAGDEVTRGAITAKSGTTLEVNGVSIGIAGAPVRIEDGTGTEADLRRGMVVTVHGTFDDRTGTAVEIEFEDAVKGRVATKTADGLSVGGQAVRIDDSTEFEDNVARLGSIAAGDRVRVSGVPDDRGGLRATRIDKLAGASEDFEVKGFVSGLSATGFTLRVSPDAADAFTVGYAAGVAPPAGVANGSIVEVRAAGPAVGGAIVATSITLEDRLGSGHGGEVEVEGIVTSGTSAAFTVAGQSVQTTAATRWLLGVPGDLAVGAKVEAEGHLDAQGVLVADKVEFRAAVRLQAAIAGFTPTGTSSATLTLLGVPVTLSPLTDYRVGFGALADGVVVQLRGIPLAGGGVMATRVEDTNDTRVFLQGVATAKDAAAGTLAVLGKTVATVPAGADATQYRDVNDGALTREAFFGKVDPGRSVVRARGKDAGAFSGTTLTAEELEFEGDR